MAVVSPEPKYKVVFLGDQSVGKTSIICRFMYEKFNTTYMPTIGIEFWGKTFFFEDRTVRLQFWDTAGQQKFKHWMPNYIRGSSVAVIVYDVTNRQSFLNTSQWIEQVHTEQGSDVIIVLVGNKTDLIDKRQVSIDEGKGKAGEFGAMFVETSAKAVFNIKVIPDGDKPYEGAKASSNLIQDPITRALKSLFIFEDAGGCDEGDHVSEPNSTNCDHALITKPNQTNSESQKRSSEGGMDAVLPSPKRVKRLCP